MRSPGDSSPSSRPRSLRAKLSRRGSLAAPALVSSKAAFWMWMRLRSTTISPLSASSRRLRENASGVMPVRSATIFFLAPSSTVVSPASGSSPPASSTR